MVWDKHPIHRPGKVKDFLACHSRLHVYEFPTSAPELNPTELVWTQISEYTASIAPHNGEYLRLRLALEALGCMNIIYSPYALIVISSRFCEWHIPRGPCHLGKIPMRKDQMSHCVRNDMRSTSYLLKTL
jgi:hypothetical protein